MSLPSERVLWVRCVEEEGWVRAIRLTNCSPDLVMDVRHGRRAEKFAYSPHGAPKTADLYWLLGARTLVEGTECTMSEQMPSMKGSTESLLRDRTRDMDVDARNTSPVKATFPSTPATVCASRCSTATPATSSFISSSVWSNSSGGKTTRASPASPTSSSCTEVELDATQLDSSASDHVDESAESGGTDVDEKLGASVMGTGSEAGTSVREQTSPESRGAKRPRDFTIHADQPHQGHDGTGPVLPSVGDEQRLSEASRPELTGDLGGAQRKKECLARSQFPRLDGHPTPGDGHRSHGRRPQQSDVKESSIQFAHSNATGGIFHDVLGSPRLSCGNENSRGIPERADGAKPKNEGGDGCEEVSAETHAAQDGMGACEATAGMQSPYSCDQSGDGMGFAGVEDEESLSTRKNGDAASSGVEQVGSRKVRGWLRAGEDSSQAPSEDSAELAVEDPKAADGVAFCRVGISGYEDRNSLKSRMKKLGWRFTSSLVTSLGSDYWIVRPGPNLREAKDGVEKFAGDEKVRKYVREAVQLSASSRSDTEDEHDGEMGEERKRVDKEQRQAAGDEERGTDADSDVNEHGDEEDDHPNHVEPSASTNNGLALQAALEALNPSNAPDVLQQRTTEFKEVLRFVTTSVTKPLGGSLYLCGVPGTGKTQTMVNVQAKVLEKFSKGKTPAPAFHSFTGTEFTSPTAMHHALWRAIAGGKEIEEGFDIEKELDRKLKYQQKRPTATSPMLVVVLDEIDQLMTHNRQVLRKLFEWADAPKSRLILVGLANSLDFDVNFSHLAKAPQRLLFQSYTPEDLASILTERVGATVHQAAIQFCAKKAAATTGDARRVINMCREAVVLAKQELQNKLDEATSEEERLQLGNGDGNDLVSIRHMAKAVAAGNAGKYSGAIAGLSFHAKVVLAVAAAAVRGVSDSRGGRGANAGKHSRLSQGDLHEKCMSAWRRLKTGEAPGQLEFTGIIDVLAASGLVALKSKHQTGGRARELVLRIEFADLAAALEDQPFFKTVTDI